MDEFLELLERLPLGALVSSAKERGLDASLAHTRSELVMALVDEEPLPPNPMQIVRSRVHRLIADNWSQLEGLMDPVCAECHKNGQQSCHDARAIGDYLVNIDLLNFEEITYP